ncbi:hypothetical protein M433DRAFT_65174 [Acidomyces richmondensis BFW]|nr:hypothetical protein M433DRAFT_65174 [Acidomyces richmondensis BFW]
MPGNLHDDCLYVCLHARGLRPTSYISDESKYHWTLLLGPKSGCTRGYGVRFRANNDTINRKWVYEEQEVPMIALNMLLVRVQIGKVDGFDREHLAAKLRRVGVKQDDAFSCAVWLRLALQTLRDDERLVGVGRFDWEVVRDTALRYCESKTKAQRFDPSYGLGGSDLRTIPTFDIIRWEEIVP